MVLSYLNTTFYGGANTLIPALMFGTRRRNIETVEERVPG